MTPAAEPAPGPLEAALLKLAALQADVDQLKAAAKRPPAGGHGDQAGAEGDAEEYVPELMPRLWQLAAPGRAELVARLGDWVEKVFRPGYGHLARPPYLLPCWPQHDLCLYQLSMLCEYHTVLSRSEVRLLNLEADWDTRILPAAMAILCDEFAKCDHPGEEQVHARMAMPAADPWAGAK